MLVLVTVAAMAAIAALTAALYVALPRTILECAERHGRFHGLATPAALADASPPRSQRFVAAVLQGAA